MNSDDAAPQQRSASDATGKNTMYSNRVHSPQGGETHSSASAQRGGAPVSALLGILLRRFSWRHARLAPGQTFLLVAILALGVAVYFAIRLANRAAVAGFENFTTAIAGQSDFILTPSAGTLDESILREIRRALGAEPVSLVPVVETAASPPRTPATAAEGGREVFQILGLDLVAAGNFLAGRAHRDAFFVREKTAGKTTLYSNRVHSPQGGETHSPESDDRIWITDELARANYLAAGDRLELVINDAIVSLAIAGTLPRVEGLPAPARSLVIVDLPVAQRLAGREHRIDRIEAIVPDGADIARRRAWVRTRLESIAHGRFDVETPASRRETGEKMTAAFRHNLTVLSLIALLVGLLLILQALDGAVVRRRHEIAVLRSLGVEARTIRLAWLVEAAAIGVAGGVLGAVLGWLAAQGAVRLVARTVNALYFATTVDAARLQPAEFIAAVVVGVAASLVAGWIPARAAAATPPAQMLGRGHVASGLVFLRRRAIGVVFIALGLAFYFAPPVQLDGGVRFPLAGYAAALCWILGGGVLAGALLRPLAALAARPARRIAPLRLATGHLRHPSGRHRLAVAGLVAAVGMTAGMIVLVASFESSVRGWLGRNLRADLFVGSDSAQNASTHNRLSPATWRALADDPDVAGAEIFVRQPVRIGGLATTLAGFSEIGDVPASDELWIDGPDVAPAAAAKTPGVAYVSESFSDRFSARRGDTVAIPTPSGPQRVRVAGVYADYGNERGVVLVPRENIAAWFGDESITSVAAYLKPGRDTEAVRVRWLEAHPGLRVLTNTNLRTDILRIFHQTFSITYALELIGVVVAVVGLALTLASMLLDRRDELTTLRALGLTRGEIARTTAWEGAATATAGTLAGLALSVALGRLLVFVVNKQAFGWTLQFVVPPLPLALVGLGVVAAGATISWFVGRWGAALPADREE